MVSSPQSYPTKDSGNSSSIEKADEARIVLGMKEGSTTTVDADDQLLMTLGYRPELKRKFSYLTVFGHGIGHLLTWQCGHCWNGLDLLCWVYTVDSGCLVLGWTGLEYANCWRTVLLVARLTPDRYRAIMCWLAGYINVLGYISIYASTICAASLILGAIASIGSGQVWVATQYMNYGMFAATILLTFLMTCVSSRVMSRMNLTYIYLQFAMLLAVIIALAAGTPSELKNSASVVFSDFQNTGYWPDDGWAFMLSFLTPVWVVSGFESSATIAEEATNAARAVPFDMMSFLVTATFTGWGVILAIAFCMGPDSVGIVTSPLGQPFAQVVYNSLGTNGSIALLTFLWISSVCNCSILMVAASHHGLPSSSFLRVLAKNKTPARAVGFVAVFSLLEGLLMLV